MPHKLISKLQYISYDCENFVIPGHKLIWQNLHIKTFNIKVWILGQINFSLQMYPSHDGF